MTSSLCPKSGYSNNTNQQGVGTIKKLIFVVPVSAIVLATPFGLTSAQDAGTRVEFGLSTTLRADDNWFMLAAPSGRGVELANALSLDLTSATRTSKVDLAIGADLDSINLPATGVFSGLYDPYARADYSQSGPNSELTLGAEISRIDLDVSRDAFDVGGGDLRNATASARFEFGQDAALGGSFGLSFLSDTYIDNTNVANFDEETQTIDGSLSLAVSRKLTLGPKVSRTDYRADDAASTRTVTTVLGVTADADVSEVLNITAAVSRDTIDSTIFALTSTTTSLDWNVAATITTPTGSQTFSIDRDLSTAGVRTGVFYDRVFAFPNFSATAGIGLTRTAAGGNEVTASFDLVQPLPNGEVSAELSRQVTTDASGTEEVNASFDGFYTYDLTDDAAILVDLDFSQSYSTASGPTGGDASLSVSYDRSVTDNWSLLTGYEHRITDDGAGTVARSNAVFVTLSRSWVSER